jgi:hypothetical protein
VFVVHSSTTELLRTSSHEAFGTDDERVAEEYINVLGHHNSLIRASNLQVQKQNKHCTLQQEPLASGGTTGYSTESSTWSSIITAKQQQQRLCRLGLSGQLGSDHLLARQQGSSPLSGRSLVITMINPSIQHQIKRGINKYCKNRRAFWSCTMVDSTDFRCSELSAKVGLSFVKPSN